LTDDEIQITMTNATGPKASLFIPEESFEQLARRQVKILEDPSSRCVDLVYDELQRIVNCIELNELKRLDVLREKITEVVNNLLRDSKAPAKEMIKNLLFLETAYINTNHPDFIGGGDAIARILKKRAQKQLTQQHLQAGTAPKDLPPELREQYELEMEQQRAKLLRQKRERRTSKKSQNREKKAKEIKPKHKPSFFSIFSGKEKDKSDESNPAPVVVMEKVPQTVVPKGINQRTDNEDFQTELIELLLKSYFKIVRKNIKDRVPKSIMFFLVNKSKEQIQNELVKELYKEDMFETLLAESDDVAQRRGNYQQSIKILAAAQRILNEIVDYKLN